MKIILDSCPPGMQPATKHLGHIQPLVATAKEIHENQFDFFIKQYNSYKASYAKFNPNEGQFSNESK